MVFEVDGKEYLLEGCRDCKVIRGYESPETSPSHKTLCKDVVPSLLCKGPNSTVLVLEETKSIKQFRFSKGNLNLANKFFGTWKC